MRGEIFPGKNLEVFSDCAQCVKSLISVVRVGIPWKRYYHLNRIQDSCFKVETIWKKYSNRSSFRGEKLTLAKKASYACDFENSSKTVLHCVSAIDEV